MPRLAPKPIAELATYDEMFGQLEEFFGFLPNDYLTMGHKPAVMKAVVELTGAVLLTAGKTSMTLRLLVMYVSSRAAGCMYCTAHCAGLALKYGLSMDKVQNIRDYQTHPSFSAAERAALTVADKANKMPNAVTDEDFGELGKYFEDEAIAEIVSLIAMMSFYNKWNDTLATTLEKP
ncbi:MAG: carboxymuconolactone decarboxylase family protein, partial [Alphaproteobacteria bacterium]